MKEIIFSNWTKDSPRLSQERNQYTGSYCRTDNSGYIARHTVLQYMIFRGSYFNAISFWLHDWPSAQQLKPVAPISGLIFFLENRFTSLTKKIPPAMERANARKPPTTMPIVVQFKKASAVMVAPTDRPRKMVAAFMMLLDAASNRREVLVPISFTRLPNINIPIKGTALGTKRATTSSLR